MDQSIGTFGRQALPMVWDYSEANAFGEMAGDFEVTLGNMIRVIKLLDPNNTGSATHNDAQNQSISTLKVVSTDPPYYDNIAYADLADYFYIWLRKALKPIFPDLFSTLVVPKNEELVALAYRHGGKDKAEIFFLDGMTKAIKNIAEQAHPAFPVSIYYAFKQSETIDGSTTSTGWETFLEAVIRAGFSIDGTWPMRTELANRIVGSGSNMLASSIVLVCQKRPQDAASISRRDFQRELREQMPEALQTMIGGETG